MASLLKWARAATRRAPSPPLRFPVTGFDVIPDSELIDEEKFEGFKRGLYYPVRIGDVFASKYQVMGKLGYGVTSTVWLARDLQTALEMFKIPRPGGEHACLVQKPMWGSLRSLTQLIPVGLFSEEVLRGALHQLFLAVDYLHTECNLVHTGMGSILTSNLPIDMATVLITCDLDIKPDNILSQIADTSILDAFVAAEMKHPSARKSVKGVTVYATRQLGIPRHFGHSVLGDFGFAVRGDVKRNHNACPEFYRPPEVMVKAAWSYPVDMWTIGTTIWDLFEGRHLFHGQDPDGKGYSTRAHLAEVIGLIGSPPLDLIQKGARSLEFFDSEGKWIAEIPTAEPTSLEIFETRLEGENKEMFLQMMRGMLIWRPEDRKTAKQMLDEPWMKIKG
ncbi:hypothetical protein IFR05_004506 [Cadophora sp. M221]|nr:hypothetical protein IFR05_004506 [Cadophora sp. M221]